MAGRFGAFSFGKSRVPGFSLYNYPPRSLFSHYPNPLRSPKFVFKMAQPEVQNGSPEVKEPSQKIAKLDQNGVHEASQSGGSLLRVKKLSEKAVLPSRGSPLAAGYDLSR